MMHNNNNGGNKNRNHKRFSKNNNFKKRRFGMGGGSSSSHIEEEFINPQARRNFAMKRDQHLIKAKECLAAGERIEAENHFQHADHYHRMANIGLDKIQQQQQQQPQGDFEQGMEADNSYSDSAPNYDEQAIDEAPEIPVDSMGSFPAVNKPAPRLSSSAAAPVVENNLSSLPFMQPLKETE